MFLFLPWGTYTCLCLCLGLPVWRHAGMASALEPSAVQGPRTPVPDRTGSSEQEPAGDTHRPHFQVSSIFLFHSSLICYATHIVWVVPFYFPSHTWVVPLILNHQHRFMLLFFNPFFLLTCDQAGTFAVPSSIWGSAGTLFQGDEAVHLNPKPVQGGQCPGGGAHLQRHDW